MAVKKAVTLSHFAWRVALAVVISVPIAVLAQDGSVQDRQSAKGDPFAQIPRAEIWYGNRRISPPPTDQVKSRPNNESYKSVARRMIQDALNLAEQGDIDGAQRLARWVKSFPVEWQQGEHSAEWLLGELALLEKRRHNGQLEEDRRLAQKRLLAKRAEPQLAPRYNEPDPLTARKSVEIEERLMVLEDAREQEVETEPVAMGEIPAVIESRSPFESVVAFLATFAGGALFTLVVCSLLIFVLFRNSARNGSVFRVELVNNANGDTVLVPVGDAETRPGLSESSAPPTFADPPALEDIPLDLAAAAGTYDEEIKRREQERVAREQAMLEFIYEKNLELRDELDEFEKKAA